MDWKTEAIKLKLEDGKPWPEVYKIIGSKYGVTDNAIRWAVRRSAEYKKQGKEIDLNAEIFKCLEKGKASAEICDAFNISKRMLTAIVEDYREEGYQITELNGQLKLCRDLVPTENYYKADWYGDKIIRFGVTSDTHLNSKWQQITHLNTLYDIFEREGIATVYHVGDIDEGVNMRQGHEYEVFNHGADAHVQYIIDNYPKRKGITTNFITGNHDHSLIKCAGYDIGKAITRERDDMVYLGQSNAKIMLTPNCKLELNHPLDGAAYAMSYTLQKTIDAMSGGEKPNILLNGHHHKSMYLFYRNIHSYECGTLQAQTPWMRGKRLASHVGGWIIEVHVNSEGTITRCKGEFIPFYKAIENDF